MRTNHPLQIMYLILKSHIVVHCVRLSLTGTTVALVSDGAQRWLRLFCTLVGCLKCRSVANSRFSGQKGYLHCGVTLNWAGLCAENTSARAKRPNASCSGAAPLRHLLVTHISMCEWPFTLTRLTRHARYGFLLWESRANSLESLTGHRSPIHC